MKEEEVRKQEEQGAFDGCFEPLDEEKLQWFGSAVAIHAGDLERDLRALKTIMPNVRMFRDVGKLEYELMELRCKLRDIYAECADMLEAQKEAPHPEA